MTYGCIQKCFVVLNVIFFAMNALVIYLRCRYRILFKILSFIGKSTINIVNDIVMISIMYVCFGVRHIIEMSYFQKNLLFHT